MPLKISISIEFYSRIVRFLYHSMAFLYISAAVQMLKLHSTLIFTAVTQKNHGNSRKSKQTTKITAKATVIVNLT